MAARSTRRVRARSRSATARPCASRRAAACFYAPGPLESVAVHWPRLVAGAQSGELYHLDVQG